MEEFYFIIKYILLVLKSIICAVVKVRFIFNNILQCFGLDHWFYSVAVWRL